MAYVAGDTIKATEYNTFVNSSSDPFGYNHFAGTGSGVYGLGQTEIATVSGGDTTITAAQFNSLITGLINIGNHTNAAYGSINHDLVGVRRAVEVVPNTNGGQ